ncbi:MAG TPA: methyltransferase domain-containing protein [Candidatus Binatia bacterium]|jgi:SAM-dependent methyltransferase
MLKRWLAHPLTRGLDVDDPRTTHLRRKIIREKGFLRRIYQEWYRAITAVLPDGQGGVLELGAGGGFMSDFIPDLITSEVFYCSSSRVILDGLRLPFMDKSLRGIVMTNVFHHLPVPRLFFAEATRCVRLGGAVAMIEPWVTPWSRFVYTRLHHEPFDPEAPLWELPISGPLSSANDALPWIIFARDRIRFEQEFPQWQIEMINPFMPFRYLVSGGVSLRGLAPGWTYGMWRDLENLVRRLNNQLAMFAQIVLRRV